MPDNQITENSNKLSLDALLTNPKKTIAFAKNNPELAARALKSVALQIQQPNLNNVKVKLDGLTTDTSKIVEALGLKDANGSVRVPDITQVDLSEFKHLLPQLNKEIKKLEQQPAHAQPKTKAQAAPMVFFTPSAVGTAAPGQRPLAANGLNLAELAQARKAREAKPGAGGS